MPKSTHFHVAHDAVTTDKKYRPEDEAIYTEDKQEFVASDQGKKAEPRTEEEFVNEEVDKKPEERE